MPDKTTEWSDSDPSFIRKDASDLVNFARRLGLSSDQVRDAVDSGLIKPAAAAMPRPLDTPAPDAEAAEPSDSAL
jgi:hypothetical protein